MNDKKKSNARIELNNLRLRIYKLIVLMLVVLYFDKKYKILGGGIYPAENILIILSGLAVLGEVLKFFDLRKEKTAISGEE